MSASWHSQNSVRSRIQFVQWTPSGPAPSGGTFRQQPRAIGGGTQPMASDRSACTSRPGGGGVSRTVPPWPQPRNRTEIIRRRMDHHSGCGGPLSLCGSLVVNSSEAAPGRLGIGALVRRKCRGSRGGWSVKLRGSRDGPWSVMPLVSAVLSVPVGGRAAQSRSHAEPASYLPTGWSDEAARNKVRPESEFSAVFSLSVL